MRLSKEILNGFSSLRCGKAENEKIPITSQLVGAVGWLYCLGGSLHFPRSSNQEAIIAFGLYFIMQKRGMNMNVNE